MANRCGMLIRFFQTDDEDAKEGKQVNHFSYLRGLAWSSTWVYFLPISPFKFCFYKTNINHNHKFNKLNLGHLNFLLWFLFRNLYRFVTFYTTFPFPNSIVHCWYSESRLLYLFTYLQIWIVNLSIDLTLRKDGSNNM